MTFCSEEQEKNKTIKNIEIEGNKYIINYFNNNKIYKNNFIEDKEKLEKIMLEQAKERETQEYLVAHINTYGSIITWFMCCGLLGKAILDGAIFISICLLIACSILLSKYKKYRQDLNELKNYKILLENYDEIKNNPNFYKLIKLNKYKYFIEKNISIGYIMVKNQKDGNVDIFNIDEFSLKDMMLIKKELKKKNIN